MHKNTFKRQKSGHSSSFALDFCLATLKFFLTLQLNNPKCASSQAAHTSACPLVKNRRVPDNHVKNRECLTNLVKNKNK